MISRQEQQQAMKKLKRMISELKADTATFNHPLSRQLVHTLSVAVDCLETALSQPERPKGRWELIHDDWNVYQCTECKEWWTLECATPQENNMNFCPFCGADMRGEEE